MNSSNCSGLDFIESLIRKHIQERHRNADHDSMSDYDDSGNSYKYIVFILVVYAVSFLALMLKYFRKSQDGLSYESLYEEFVKRDKFKVERELLQRRAMMANALAEQIPLASLGFSLPYAIKPICDDENMEFFCKISRQSDSNANCGGDQLTPNKSDLERQLHPQTEKASKQSEGLGRNLSSTSHEDIVVDSVEYVKEA